jgi:Protein of unknown function (DUF3822)
LKTAFKILPVNTNVNSGELLIELGGESISFLYFSDHPLRVNALFIYHFEKNISSFDMANELDSFFQEEQLPGFTKCYLCYNFRECTLVPQALYREDLLPGILKCIFPENSCAAYYAEPVKGLDAAAAYQVDERVEAVIKKQFAPQNIHHSLALQLPLLHEQGDACYCIVYQHCIKVMLIKKGLLQIAQFFDYTTPSDVAYHLLNVCQQHDILPGEVELSLSGFIDKKSNLYDELHRYFLQIHMQEGDREKSHAVELYPAHFFSHLISLALCVS